MTARPFLAKAGLMDRIIMLGRLPRLVALDYDGTLSALAPTPGRASTPPSTLALLARLAAAPGTRVAVVSGRPLEDLKARLPVPRLVLVGNHGLTSTEPGLGAGPRQCRKWESVAMGLATALLEPASRVPGCLVEYKGVDLSLHHRLAKPGQARGLLAQAEAMAREAGFVARAGKAVLELRPKTEHGKGRALTRLAARLSPRWRSSGSLFYAGDDATDEDAFKALALLGPRVTTVKVGPGPTAAAWRVPGPAALAQLLTLL